MPLFLKLLLLIGWLGMMICFALAKIFTAANKMTTIPTKIRIEAAMTPQVNHMFQNEGDNRVSLPNRLFSRCVVYLTWKSLISHWSRCWGSLLLSSTMEKVGSSELGLRRTGSFFLRVLMIWSTNTMIYRHIHNRRNCQRIENSSMCVYVCVLLICKVDLFYNCIRKEREKKRRSINAMCVSVLSCLCVKLSHQAHTFNNSHHHCCSVQVEVRHRDLLWRLIVAVAAEQLRPFYPWFAWPWSKMLARRWWSPLQMFPRKV